MEDLTIIHTTLNKLPIKWQRFYKQMLIEAAGGAEIITLSKQPMKWGLNIIQTEPTGLTNIFYQILKGAKVAKTPYVAIAEDDTVYPKEHFKFRPPKGYVAYNLTRWVILTWLEEPFYFYKGWTGNCTMIADRKYLIEALEERFDKYKVFPGSLEVGMNWKEKKYGLIERKRIKFNTVDPIVNLNHIHSQFKHERTMRRKPKPVRAYDIPYWGRPENILKHYV